jgi:hypothetical protein
MIREEIANAMGGNFADAQVGAAGNLAGMSAPLGCPTPLTKKSCVPLRQRLNKQQQDKRSKLVSILLGKTFPREQIQEKKLANTISVQDGKSTISGLADKTALSLPPSKNVPVNRNRLASGVNGFSTPPPVIATAVSDLVSVGERYPSMMSKFDAQRAVTDGTYLYKTKNVAGQADQYNNLRGIEMGSFFRSEEDSDIDQLVNDTVAKHFDTHKIE